MINAGTLLASSRKLIFGSLVRSRVDWDEFVHFKVRANETYSDSKRQFSARNRDVLMNAQSPHKWGPLLSLLCSA